MAISRYNRPADLNLIDTYVPLPFREIKQAITEKQDRYDQTEEIFNKAPGVLDSVNVNEYWVDSYGKTVGKNLAFDVVKAKKDQVQKEQEDLAAKYKNDWSSPEAQREIKAWATNLGSWYENTGKPLQAKSNAYFKAKEEAGKKKNQMGYQDTYFAFNNLINNEARKSAEGKVDFDWQDPTYNEYLDKSEAVNKATNNLGAIIKEWSGGRKTNLNDLTAEEYKTFRKSNASQIESAKSGLMSQLQQKHQQEAFELARQLAPEGQSPEEYYNETVKIKVSSRDSKGNTITKEVPYKRGDLLKKQLDQEVSNLFDAKLNIEKKDLTDYSNLNEAQLGKLGIGTDGSPLANQYYESSSVPLQNELNFELVSDPNLYLAKKLGVEAVNPTGLLGIKTPDGKEVTNKLTGQRIQDLQKEYEAKTGKKSSGILNYEDEFISWLDKSKGIKWANEVGHKNKNIGTAVFTYNDSDYKKELKIAESLKNVLSNPKNPSYREEVIKYIPSFKGVYKLLESQGIKNPSKEQLVATYNQIAPAFSTGEEVTIDRDTQISTLTDILTNQRHIGVSNKLDLKRDTKIPINDLPVYYKGEEKKLGELLAEGISTKELIDDGAIAVAKETLNPSSAGGTTIKLRNSDGNLVEYQTGGDNNQERSFFKNNNNYYPEINSANNFYSNSSGEDVIGESTEKITNDPLVRDYLLQKTGFDIVDSGRPFYSTVKMVTMEKEDGTYAPVTLVYTYDAYSGKQIGKPFQRDSFMKYRESRYNKGNITLPSREKEKKYN